MLTALRLVHLVKVPLAVKASRDVTVAIAPESRAVAKLVFTHRRGRERLTNAVRFKSCKRDEPAFGHDGKVGEATSYNGGWVLKEPACVALEIWERGRPEPYKARLALGDSCAGA